MRSDSVAMRAQEDVKQFEELLWQLVVMYAAKAHRSAIPYPTHISVISAVSFQTFRLFTQL